MQMLKDVMKGAHIYLDLYMLRYREKDKSKSIKIKPTGRTK